MQTSRWGSSVDMAKNIRAVVLLARPHAGPDLDQLFLINMRCCGEFTKILI